RAATGAAARGSACARRAECIVRLRRTRAAREAARRRHPDRRGVRGRQSQDPRKLTHAIAAMRSRVPGPTARLPELLVEDSPHAADLALLEDQVAAAAIAAAG